MFFFSCRFPCEVRVRAVPLQPCRRHGKKRKDEEPELKLKEVNPKNLSPTGVQNSPSPMQQSLDMQSMMDGLELQLQSSQVSSTVLDSPVSMYQGWNYQNASENEVQLSDERWNRAWGAPESHKKQNWLNSAQMTSQWDYSRFPSDTNVDPDSTTNQVC